MYYFPIKHSRYNRFFFFFLFFRWVSSFFSLFCVSRRKMNIYEREKKKKKELVVAALELRSLSFLYLYSSISFFFIIQNKSVICACWCLFYVDLKCQTNQNYCLYVTITASYLICKNKAYSLSETIIFAYVFNGFFSSSLFLLVLSSFFSLCVIAFWPHQRHMQVFTHTTIWSYALSVYIALFRSRI